MKTGIFVFDNSQESTQVKITKAAEYYEAGWGQKPNLCLVRPGSLRNGKRKIGDLTVRTYPPVLPDFIWIGVEVQL